MNLLINLFGGSYEDLWKAIIRPTRNDYNDGELGPYKFELKGKCYKRTDFELRNNRSQKLMCSFWEPFDEEREQNRLPCVIYLHGNSSSRCEAYPEVQYLLQRNITVFSFDFCGCGKSEGEYISLGYYEKKDIHCIIEFLLKSQNVSKIGLWGRSMGAVAAIMYANEHPQLIDVMILDSGFYSLKMLMKELIESKISLPSFIYDKVLNMVKETIKEKANFDLDIIEPYIYAKNCLVPAFFCHGSDDNFVFPHHSVDLFNEYKGKDKCCEIVKGYHNSSRPRELKTKICDFLMKYLKDDDLESNETINNSNTYGRLDINNHFFKIIDKTNNLIHSVNNIEIKPKNYKKSTNQIQTIRNNFNGFLNEKNIDVQLNENSFLSQKMRTYSQTKYSKNNLNKKNTIDNVIKRKLKLKKPKKNKNEENISSSSSSSSSDNKNQLHIYQKKNMREPFKSIKLKTFSISQYYNNNIKSVNNLNKTSLIKKMDFINLNNNNKTNRKKINNNNYSYSFLRNDKRVDISITNPIFKSNNNQMQNIKNDKNMTVGNKIFYETKNSNNAPNIIQNKYFTTNNIYLNTYVGNIPKKNVPYVNFSYTSKKPTDRYVFKLKNKEKNFHNEIKKNILIKSFDINKRQVPNILNNKNINYMKINSKSSSIFLPENTFLDANDETYGRKLPY